MAKWYEAANEASFKLVAAGYVFQSPNPWMFARPRYYLVNEAQKAEIAARLGRWRLVLVVAVAIMMAILASFIAFVTLSPGTFIRLVGPVIDQYGINSIVPLTVVLMTLVVAPFVAVPQVYLVRALRPLLAEAPRTSERIKIGEQLPKIAVAASKWVLAAGLVGGLGMIAAASLMLLDNFLDGDLTRRLLLPVILLVNGGLTSGYFVYLLRLRARLKRVAL